ncbi:MAG: M28 family peptidase [Niabella sp.]
MMMYRFLFTCLSCFILTCASAQKVADPQVYAKSITANDLKKHLTIIAGEEMEGRDTPSPGLGKAAEYISSQFKKFGVKPGNNGDYRQSYKLLKDSVIDMGLSINGTAFKPYVDFAPGIPIPEEVSLKFSEFCFVGYGIVDEGINDYGNMEVDGKLVVMLEGAPDAYKPKQTGRLSPAFLMNKLRVAQEKGAAAVLFVTRTVQGRYAVRTKYRPLITQKQPLPAMPVFNVSEALSEYVDDGYDIQTIKRAMEYNQVQIPLTVRADVQLQYKLQRDIAQASNVIGVVEGSDKKDEYVFVTAHYDHVGKDAKGNIFYGADDDGSGTVSVLEMAEAFALAKKAGKGPRRTMVFMTVSGEEKGLWGSEYYVDNPIYPLDKTSVDLNIDMIGRIGSDYENDKDSVNYIYIIGDDKLSTDLTPITNKVNNKYTRLKLDRRYNDPNDPERFYYRSDHFNFAKNGVPAIFYFNGTHADYHKITDTVDKINFPLLAHRAQLVFYTAWDMANRDNIVKRDLELPEMAR